MDEYLELFNEMDVRLAGSKLNINDTDYTLNQFRKGIFDIIDAEHPKMISLIIMEKKDSGKFKTVTKGIFDAIKKELRPTTETGLENSAYIENLTPVVNMSIDEVFLVNEALEIISDITYKSWLKAITPEYRKIVLTDSMPMAKFYFDPYTDTRVSRGVVDGAEEMVFINTYIRPHWMEGAEASKVCPEILDQFMRHLLPCDKQRHYCYQWMAEALFGRNETYLVLNGDKGVGKNTIYEFMKAVTGPRYAAAVPASLTTGYFNSILKDKRLLLMDEYKITRSNHLFLKKIINKNQTIEKKGFDAETEIETFNSFMVFHNSISDMYVEKDDRRFSVLDLTSKNLTAIWTPDFIHDLMLELNNPKSELTKGIGQYLMHINEEDFNSVTPYKGSKFHEIVEYHMPTWLQIVVAMVENGEVKKGAISFKKEIEKRLSNEMMGKKKIQWRKTTLQKILREYKYKDQWILGTIDTDGVGGSLQLTINPELLEEFNYQELEEIEADFDTEEDGDLL